MGIHTLIEYEKPNRTYCSGETVRGRVVVVNGTRDVQLLSSRIFIFFYGGAATDLTGKEVTNENSAVVPVNGENSNANEIYLYSKVYLSPEDSTTVQVVPGRNGFPFEFELPFHLPSDFLGSLGYVQYRAVTSVSLFGFSGKTFKDTAMFHVINIQDLNLSSIAGRNSYFSFEKLVSVRPDFTRRETFGLINSVVKLPYQGYIPGERIDMEIQLNNQSGLRLKYVMVELIREVRYTCPAGTVSEKDAVLDTWRKAQTSSANAREREIFALLKIPPNTLPTSSQFSSLVSIQYFVNIYAKLDTARTTVAVGKIPILIGTVPLRQIEGRPPTQEQIERPPSRQSEESTPSSSRHGSLRRGSLRRGSAMELEGAVGGSHVHTLAPLASSEEHEDEFPPSYSEAITMPQPL